jgi:hypothetical protein
MWFGTTSHMQWVPCPLIDSAVTRNRYVERMQFENGGGDVARSNGYQMEYNLTFTGLAHELEGIDAFNKFASGFYGSGFIYMAHPAAYETNLFSAAWATPGLIEQGWVNNFDTTATFSNTASNSYNLPPRSAVIPVTVSSGGFYKKFIIPIPPTHTLHLGATGSATGSAVVRVRPITTSYSYGSTTDLTLISTSSSTRMNASFAGSSYVAVEVYITRTSSATSTITLTSLMARLYKTGITPNLTGNHYQGEGSTGLMFADDAIVENYSYMFPPRKGISTTLVEVEAWR